MYCIKFLYFHFAAKANKDISIYLSLSLYLSLFPHALASVSPICTRYKHAPSLLLSLSLSCSPVSDPFPLPLRLYISPAVLLHYVRAILSSLSLHPAAVRTRTFASAASRADRAPACLPTIPLPRVARPSSVCACVPFPRLRCLVRTLPERSPGRC